MAAQRKGTTKKKAQKKKAASKAKSAVKAAPSGRSGGESDLRRAAVSFAYRRLQNR